MAKNGNNNLHMSRAGKQDEFYTQISMIEKELKYYKKHFYGKVVFCNCDDPEESNFWKYFQLNFYELGLKKLISTHYEENRTSYKLEISIDDDNSGQLSIPDYTRTQLKQNGDFRSHECVEILKEADIIVTNPPFSLFREYIEQLIKYKKKFLVIGNINNITYNEIMPLYRNGEIWLGRNSGHFWFRVPNYYEPKATDFKIDELGVKWRRMGNICWFTNLDYKERYEDIVLYKTYTPEDYPKYENFDAIHIKECKDIPLDYYGLMGVPITFCAKHNPKQFEYLGIDKEFTQKKERFKLKLPNGNIKTQYARVLIRRVKNNED